MILFLLLGCLLSSFSFAKTNSHLKPKSNEWEKLPRQAWEMTPMKYAKIPQNTEPKRPLQFEPRLIPQSQKLPFFGKIIGSRLEKKIISTQDIVYIQNEKDQAIHPGKIYAIVNEPRQVKEPRSDRKSYTYLILGHVKILTSKNKIFIGKVTHAYEPFEKGSFLAEIPQKKVVLTPLPGLKKIQGRIIFSPYQNTTQGVQHQEALIDLGSDDGIQPGMVFRIQQGEDPFHGEMIITTVSEFFSGTLITRSKKSISEHGIATLLLDISPSSLSTTEESENLMEQETSGEENLDYLLKTGPLSEEKKEELKELESLKNSQEMQEVVETPSPPLAPPSPTTPEEPLPPLPEAPVPPLPPTLEPQPEEGSTQPSTTTTTTPLPVAEATMTPAPIPTTSDLDSSTFSIPEPPVPPLPAISPTP